jgi:Mycobacterial 4 TMS phage holin, superfamily IV
MVLRRGSHLLRETGGASDAGGTVGLPTGTLLLTILTLLLTILTFGLFLLVVNALMLWLAASLVPGFAVAGFVPALLGAIPVGRPQDHCPPPRVGLKGRVSRTECGGGI